MTQSLINTTIKPFKSTAFHNGEFVDVTEKDIAGKWAVFFFYPADFTFVCPTELGDMADHYAQLQEMGVEVYSVSTDKHFTHKAWHSSSDTINKITFPMLGDPTGEISRNFGVLVEDDGVALRGTFVVNPEGEIKVSEVHDLGIGRSAAELVRKIQAAQYVAEHDGEVCPAAWKPGSETLTPSLDLVGKI
ncbi:alkyl hydroperoxide reductase subunit C [Pleionea mediterranea]|jgi:peroxiredoxin (alkyl hydroperoxide reductase subunit C)|uniref:Alkyl hydroperoxide reductase C n=1 Tax=Pleionea mediterranea TaxID=523701 RepID=A0A316FZ60_9GAMM|nr:alkyl hydroperoxide reductase subunit C [Pleionea mediterranea]PWK53859.1 peroxiredoxin (alkyl hydroperoxide reductase subunit C) [Pleionea mediterranea]